MLGIYCYSKYPIDINTNYVLASSLLFSICFYYTQKINLFGISCLALCFVLGFINLQHHYSISSCKTCISFHKKQFDLSVTVIDRPKINNSETKMYVPVKCHQAPISDFKNISKFIAIINLNDTTATSDLLIGDQLYLKGSLLKIKKNRNAHTFNFQRYMKNKGFEYNFYVKTWQKLRSIEESKARFFHKIQIQSIGILRQYIHNTDAFAIAVAMALGYKEHLTADIEDTYRETGAAHIIAVSGLHVDIISVLLFLIIGQFYRLNYVLYVSSCFLMIAFLCSYSMLVGNSPSVMRAVCMYSLLFVSKMSGKGYPIWNILAATAFGMLLFNPAYLFDVGFQFSFIAVCSIVYFFPILKKINKLKVKPTKFLFDVLLVSVSVQFLIAPLSIYYFNYFPILFFISNSFLIIFIYIIIIGSALIILLSFISSNSTNLVAVLLENIIVFLNQTLSQIQSLPYCIIDNLYLSKCDVCIAYLYLFLVAYVLKHPSIAKIKMLSLIICIHILISVVQEIYVRELPRFYVYEQRDNIRIDFLYNKECYSYSHNGKPNNYLTNGYRLANRVNQIHELNDTNFQGTYLIKKDKFIQFFNHLILLDYEGNIENTQDFNTIIVKPNLTVNRPKGTFQFILNTRDSTSCDFMNYNIYHDGPLLKKLNIND